MPSFLVRAFEGAPEELRQPLLRAVLQLSRSRDLAHRLVECGVLDHIPPFLLEGSLHGEDVASCIEVLWNLLDAAPAAEMRPETATAMARALQRMMVEATAQGFRMHDKVRDRASR